MKTVAFLQNMWVRHPRTAAKVMKWPAVSREREKMIAYALFAGCLTGRRLRNAFGDLCDSIIWQEANPTVSTNASQYYPPDVWHIAEVLTIHQPAAVLCLTRRGESVIHDLCTVRGLRFLSAPHPAARGAMVADDLARAAESLRSILAA